MISRRGTVAGLTSLAIASHARAAGDPWPDRLKAAIDALQSQGRYLPLHRLGRAGDDPGFRDALEQAKAFVGDEAGALARAGGRSRATPPDLSDAKAEDAIAAIVRASAGRRVVMLNEAHTASRHRMFLAQVLRALHREGFTHLAAETFSSDSPMAEQVGALRPGGRLHLGLGYYIADPVYAEAVREALELGYRLVPYEQREDQQSPSRDPAARIPIREQAQADNLSAALARWPKGRFVVFVGYGHLNERDDPTYGPWFAARLARDAGLDPLTVHQSNVGSFGPHAADNPLTRAVLARFRPSRPIVVSPSPRLDGWPQADLDVFHPSLPDRDGRPGWLAGDARRRRIRLSLPSPAREPMLVQAVPSADSDPAIPADQYPLMDGAREAVLYLRPGRYRVRLETPDGFIPQGAVRA